MATVNRLMGIWGKAGTVFNIRCNPSLIRHHDKGKTLMMVVCLQKREINGCIRCYQIKHNLSMLKNHDIYACMCTCLCAVCASMYIIVLLVKECQ